MNFSTGLIPPLLPRRIMQRTRRNSRPLKQVEAFKTESLDRLDLFHHFMRNITMGIHIEELLYRSLHGERSLFPLVIFNYIHTHTHIHAGIRSTR